MKPAFALVVVALVVVDVSQYQSTLDVRTHVVPQDCISNVGGVEAC